MNEDNGFESNGTATAEDLPPSGLELPPSGQEDLPAPDDVLDETVAEPNDAAPPAAAEGTGDDGDDEDPDDGVLIQYREKAEEIRALRAELLREEGKLEEQKKKVKGIESKIDEMHRDLEDMILQNAPGPLFEHAEKEKKAEEESRSREPIGETISGITILEPESPEDDLSWRDVRIDTLDLTPSIIEALAAANVHTIGQHADFVDPAKNGGRQNVWQDVKGVGPKKVEKIDAALDQFWKNWRAAKDERARLAAEAKEHEDALARAEAEGMPPAPEEAPSAAVNFAGQDPNNED